jgi:SAM-dependent methyltransferase
MSAPEPPPPVPWSAEFWDARYASADRVWSGEPNPQLVADVSAVPPGRALDVGAGEGADSIWLARQGWTVVAVDVSSVALDRARRHAEFAGVADRISWVHGDVLAGPLPAGPFDLVSVEFMHVPLAERTELFRRCIDAVGPGGLLQIVGHHPSDLATGARRPARHDVFYAAEEIAGLLDDGWTVLACDARPRPAVDHQGAPITIHDAVLLARRG